MSFEKHSNFNKLANFSEVKFGENMPVLEVELNEMQQIQNEARADIIRDTMPSGFVTLGEIDYDYCANNNNQIKLSTESIAYVNGYRITIPKDTIIEIGESDKEREDLVFLEVWKEAVNDVDTLTEYGGENNSVINNPIKDERYPIATSQRVQLKYRIRVHKNAPFDNQYFIDGLGLKMASNPPSNYPLCTYGCGSNNNTYESLNNNDLRYIAMFRKTSVRDYVWQDTGLDDEGLFVAGATHKAFESVVGSIDGLSYAIPMFRLKRKPNVGLSSPFEYKKIHNQLDPKKFAHLVGQENVEKVHSVEIAGRTYNNHTLNTKDISLRGHGSFIGFHLQHSEVSKPLKTDTDYLFIVNVKSNTLVGDYDYSLDFGETDPSNSRQQSCFTSQFSLPLNALGFSTHILHTKNSFDGVYCVSRNQLSNSAKSGGIVFDYMIIEYSPELVNIDFISYFEGVKSLGELTNNSITVENNLVEEGTYVHELQNHILPTHPEVTHVTWGEDVVIPPEVEIELKNGEEVVQTITQLPVKLETTGEEKLHVKTMKGKTLVNLMTKCKEETIVRYDSPGNPSEDVANVQMLKPNTEYTLFYKAKYRTSGDGAGTNGGLVIATTVDSSKWHGTGKVLTTTYKQYVHKFTTHSTIDGFVLRSNGSYFAIKECVLLEGDYTNQDISYFTGMKSVEAPSIKITGKNLYYTPQKEEKWEGACIKVNQGNTVTYVPHSSNGIEMSTTCYFPTPIKASPNTVFTYSIEHLDGGNSVFTGAINNYLLVSLKNGEVATIIPPDFTSSNFNGKITYTFTFTDNMKEIIGINPIGYSVQNLTKELTLRYQLQYGDTATIFEPYKLHTFRTPKGTVLRSLPHSVFDSIDLTSGLYTQRVGLVSFEGSSDDRWISNTDFDTESTKFFFTYNDILRSGIKKIHSSSSHYVLNDYFISANSDHRDVIKSKKIEGVLGGDGHDGMIQFFIRRDRLSSLDDIGFNQWLANNPVHVQYVLAQPITKKIGLSENDYVGKSKVTYQLAEPLRKIDSYCDFILGNKLHSYIDKVVFNGSESWEVDTNFISDTLNEFKINLGFSIKDSNLVICDRLLCTPKEDTERIYILPDGRVYIRMLKSEMTSVATFKQWLSENPLTVYFVRSNPVITPLKEVSPLVSPMPLNSYVGSLYLTNGINQTKFLTDFSPSEYEVQTYHRHFSSEFNMFEDIKRKKSPYGHKTYLEELDGVFVEQFIAGLEKHEIEDLRHKVSLTGFDYNQLLQDSFLKLIEGELS